jgi:hypothetical protein
MDSRTSIGANSAPEDAVLPQARGGFLGVLMLDTRFPRWPGDIGHPDSFGGPVRHVVVPGAWPASVVASAQSLRTSGLALRFAAEARKLEAAGAFAITTSCGFLVLFQDELQAAVRIPVVTSSLLQLPGLLRAHQQVGVLTISAAQLGPQHLRCAGVPESRLGDVIVQGLDPQGAFARPILANEPERDFAAAQLDVVRAACELRGRAPDLQAAVLECTNLPPHAATAAAASGLTLHSLLGDPRLRLIPTQGTPGS